MDHNITKTGIWTGGPWENSDIVKINKNNIQIGENLVLNSYGLLASNLGPADGSRREYFAINLGQSLPLNTNDNITISFDLYMTVKTANPSLQVYNTNNKGPHQVTGGINIFAGETHTVGEIISKRVILNTKIAATRTDANKTEDYLEFYSNYGSNNWFSVSNLKIEKGHNGGIWTPANGEFGMPIINNEILYNPIEANQFYEY